VITEVRTLLLFWAFIVIAWLWGGLHMAYGQLWMMVLFCIFNVAVVSYVLSLFLPS
jgi:G-protein coupled receptor 98